jgi:hypothetical protein
MIEGTDEDFVAGYMEGGDPDAPEPSANRSPAYVHSFRVRRAEVELARRQWMAP